MRVVITRIVQWWRRRRHQRATPTSARVRDHFKQISNERRMQVYEILRLHDHRFKMMREGIDVRLGRAAPEPRLDQEIQTRVARSS